MGMCHPRRVMWQADGFKRAVCLFTHEPVVKRHLMVSGSLALLLCCFEVAEGSRAAAPRGDKVL